MTAEAQPQEGQKVSVWTEDGHHVFSGEITDVDPPKPGQTRAEIVIREDAPVEPEP